MSKGVWALVATAAATAIILLSGCGPSPASSAHSSAVSAAFGSADVEFTGAVTREARYGSEIPETHVSCSLDRGDGDFQVGISEQGDSFLDNYGAQDGVFFTLFGQGVPSGELSVGSDDSSSVVAQVKEFTGRRRLFRADPTRPCTLKVSAGSTGDLLHGSFSCPRMLNETGDEVSLSGRFDCPFFSY